MRGEVGTQLLLKQDRGLDGDHKTVLSPESTPQTAQDMVSLLLVLVLVLQVAAKAHVGL